MAREIQKAQLRDQYGTTVDSRDYYVGHFNPDEEHSQSRTLTIGGREIVFAENVHHEEDLPYDFMIKTNVGGEDKILLTVSAGDEPKLSLGIAPGLMVTILDSADLRGNLRIMKSFVRATILEMQKSTLSDDLSLELRELTS